MALERTAAFAPGAVLAVGSRAHSSPVWAAARHGACAAAGVSLKGLVGVAAGWAASSARLAGASVCLDAVAACAGAALCAVADAACSAGAASRAAAFAAFHHRFDEPDQRGLAPLCGALLSADS